VAFQGELGAYSEEALRAYFGERSEPIPCATFRDVFERLKRKEVAFAVLPVENSIAGPVHESQTLLKEYQPQIEGEIGLRVRHCLLGYPGSSLTVIQKVISHPQALAQSKEFLEKLGVQIAAFYDTAGAAKWVSEHGRIDVAAIASRRAAAHYGLVVLQEGIESDTTNTTRFLVLRSA
jgi:prephenate dehydratase